MAPPAGAKAPGRSRTGQDQRRLTSWQTVRKLYPGDELQVSSQCFCVTFVHAGKTDADPIDGSSHIVSYGPIAQFLLLYLYVVHRHDLSKSALNLFFV